VTEEESLAIRRPLREAGVAPFGAKALAGLFVLAAFVVTLIAGVAAADCPGIEETLSAIERAPTVAESARDRIEAARCYRTSGEYLALWRVLSPVVESAERGAAWDEAMEILGDALLARGLYLRAATAYSAALAEASGGVAAQHARASLESLLPALEPGERRYLLHRFPGSGVLCETRAAMAEAALEQGDAEEALRLARVGGCEGQGRVTDRITDALSTASARLAASRGDDFFTIGVLGPLTGELARYGEALSQGVSLAIEEHNRRSPVELSVRVVNTASDPVRAAAAAETLAASGAGAVVGDILSSATLVAAASLRASETVLVSPAAVEDRIGLVGPHVFQSMVPRRLQGRALAEYAVRQRGWRRLAVLSPETDDAASLAAAFTGRVRELESEIVFEESFEPGDVYFGPVLQRVAETAPDALFAAGETDELAELVSQLARQGGGIALLGPETFGQPEVLSALTDLPGEAAYVEDYYLLPASREEAFLERYRELYGAAPDRFARNGYVAATLLAKAYEAGAYSRRSLRERLESKLGADPFLKRRRILEPDEDVARVAVYRVERGEVVRADP